MKDEEELLKGRRSCQAWRENKAEVRGGKVGQVETEGRSPMGLIEKRE